MDKHDSDEAFPSQGRSARPADTARRMRLRYPGRCRSCSDHLPAGSVAIYDAATRTVSCIGCEDRATAEQPKASSPVDAGGGGSDLAGGTPDVPPVARYRDRPPPLVGTAGASARREHQRRHQRRQDRVRAAHPRIGGLLLALTDDPQSTRAWATGADGEERLATRLDAAAGESLRLLHDRRIPRTRANIDHIAITPTGIHVIDAKRYRGRPDVRVEGGLLRPRVERLVVGRRDCTALVEGLDKQVAAVRAAIDDTHPDLPVQGVLCFVDADRPLLGGGFTVRGLDVTSPRRLVKRLQTAGAIRLDAIREIHELLAERLPAA